MVTARHQVNSVNGVKHATNRCWTETTKTKGWEQVMLQRYQCMLLFFATFLPSSILPNI